MVKRKPSKVLKRERKAKSARRKIRQYSDRPRLSVFRSLKNIYCQIIDDQRAHTVVMASTGDKSLRKDLEGLKKTDAAAKVGEELAKRAVKAGVTKVAFDRGGAKYHGRVKALADAARKGGLEF